MTTILKGNEVEPVVYELRFYKRRKLVAGFECDSDGVVKLHKLTPQAAFNLGQLEASKGVTKKIEPRDCY
jgi:hypothetical protein